MARGAIYTRLIHLSATVSIKKALTYEYSRGFSSSIELLRDALNCCNLQMPQFVHPTLNKALSDNSQGSYSIAVKSTATMGQIARELALYNFFLNI